MDPQVPNISTEPSEVFPTPQVSQTAPPTKKEKDNHWISILAMAIFVVLSLGVVAFLYYQNQSLQSMLVTYQTPISSPTPLVTPIPTVTIGPSPEATVSGKPSPKTSPVACSMEAKLCADGSYVSRTGPNCEFTACPQ